MKLFLGCILFILVNLNCLRATDQIRYINVDGVKVKLLNLPKEELHIKQDADHLTLPLKRAGNLFLIEAEIDSVRGNFVLDLGAPFLVLNSTYFRDYKVNKSYLGGTLTSKTDYVRKKRVKQLQIQDLIYENMSASVTDLGQIENRRGIKILGLLGVALFEKFVFDLDLYHLQLHLHKTIDSLNPDTDLILKTSVSVNNNVISLKAKSGGVTLYLSLDTAAEANILDNKLSSKVYKRMNVLRNSRVRDANGGIQEVLLTFIEGILIADVEVRKMKTLILNLSTMSKAYGQNIDGMLGYPFFSWGRTIIDFKKRKLYIYEFNRSKNHGK